MSFVDSLVRQVGSTLGIKSATPNISFFAIPAVWVISILCHFYAAANAPTKDGNSGFTNVSPRGYLASIQRKEKKSPAEEHYIRAEAAQQNGFENLPFFAAAIIAGNLAKLPVDFLNTAAVIYVVSRIFYSVAYITTTSEPLANVRSVLFLVGVSTCFTLFVRAGLALQ